MLLRTSSRNVLSLLLCLLLAAVYLPGVHSASTTYLGVWSSPHSSKDIQDPSLTPGSRLTININATDLPPVVNDTYGGINGFDITVQYDPAVLNATNADFKAPLCPAADGCLFDQPGSYLELARKINHTAGTVEVAAVLIWPGIATGSGILFRIEFQVLATGSSTINIDSSSKLTSPAGFEVVPAPYATLDGSFNNVPANSPPTALFTYNPSSPVAGQQVSFNASDSYDPDGPIATYAWDFGDGTTGTGAEVSHSFQYTGTFTVALTVTDGQGSTAMKAQTLTVAASTGGTGGTGGNGNPGNGGNTGGQAPPAPGPLIPVEIIAGIAAVALSALLLVLVLRQRRKPKPNQP